MINRRNTNCLVIFAALAGLAACETTTNLATTSPETPALGTNNPAAVCRALIGEERETDGGLGGTGIYGTVTALNALAVDGRPLYLADNAQIASVLGTSKASDLRIGEVLMLQALPVADGFCALDVSKFMPIVGQVDEVDVLAGALSILGSTVEVGEETVVVGSNGEAVELSALSAGTALAVSGTWDGKSINATNLRILEGRDSRVASVTGTLRRSAGGQLVIGSTPVNVSGNARAGSVVSVVGQVRDGILEAETVRSDLASIPGFGQRGAAAASLRAAVIAASQGNETAIATLADARQDLRDTIAETLSEASDLRSSDLADAAEAAGRSGGRSGPSPRQ